MNAMFDTKSVNNHPFLINNSTNKAELSTTIIIMIKNCITIIARPPKFMAEATLL